MTGKNVDDQQLCVIWTNVFLAGVSLSGFLNILDLESGLVSKVLKGHNKPITALTVCPAKLLAFTADFEGNISQFFFSLRKNTFHGSIRSNIVFACQFFQICGSCLYNVCISFSVGCPIIF